MSVASVQIRSKSFKWMGFEEVLAFFGGYPEDWQDFLYNSLLRL
jgi:hypothetical protein